MPCLYKTDILLYVCQSQVSCNGCRWLGYFQIVVHMKGSETFYKATIFTTLKVTEPTWGSVIQSIMVTTEERGMEKLRTAPFGSGKLTTPLQHLVCKLYCIPTTGATKIFLWGGGGSSPWNYIYIYKHYVWFLKTMLRKLCQNFQVDV